MEEIYGPEDIEQLLLSKDYSELYPEEREYVLRHMEGEQEYTIMRQMLLGISADDVEQTPPVSMREELITLHESQHRSSGFKIWLNSVLTAIVPSGEWRRPALQLATVAGAVILVLLVYRTMAPDLHKGEMAYEPELQEEKQAPKEVEDMDAPTLTQERVQKSEQNSQVERNELEQEMPADAVTSSDAVMDDKVAKDDLDLKPEEVKFDIAKSPDLAANQVVIEIIEDEEEVQAEIVFADESADFEIESTETLEDVMEPAFDNFAIEETASEETQAKSRADRDVSDMDGLASAPTATSIDSNALGNTILSSSAKVPKELLSQLYTAW